jgi:CDP-diacylglycerol---glycerol-3-phosphate 3-phosphatidyltransferase
LINVANAVTLTRVLLSLVVAGLLWLPASPVRWVCFVLTILVIWADALDGYLARKLHQTSRFGATLDIAGDRIVELVYWITLAALNWIPLWIPLVFLVRGAFVDLIRTHAAEQGYTAFGEKTMMASPLGRLLVASNFSRFTYAVVKAFAFCLLIAAHTVELAGTVLPTVAMACAYAATIFCIIRGLPVLLEGRRLIAGAP